MAEPEYNENGPSITKLKSHVSDKNIQLFSVYVSLIYSE